jgi:hypothetical protein
MTAILAGVLAILVALISGTDGGDSSGGSHQAASAPGFAFQAQEKSESARTAAPRDDRNRPANGQVRREGRPSSAGPSRSTDQPEDAGGTAPVVTPQPAPQPNPTPAPRPKPTPPPRPQPPPALPQAPAQPAPPEAVQPPITIANNNDGP